MIEKIRQAILSCSKLVQMLEEESNERPDDGYHPAV